MLQKINSIITGLEFERKKCEQLWHKANVNKHKANANPQMIAFKSRIDTLSMCIKQLKEAVHE
jgi:hypothetical protein